MTDQDDLDKLRRELRDEQYRLDRQQAKLVDTQNQVAQFKTWVDGTLERIDALKARIDEVEELLTLRERVAALEAGEPHVRGVVDDGDE